MNNPKFFQHKGTMHVLNCILVQLTHIKTLTAKLDYISVVATGDGNLFNKEVAAARFSSSLIGHVNIYVPCCSLTSLFNAVSELVTST